MIIMAMMRRMMIIVIVVHICSGHWHVTKIPNYQTPQRGAHGLTGTGPA